MDYKALHLKREAIDEYINEFVKLNSLTLRSCDKLDNNKKKRVIIGRPGIDDAMIDIFLNADGTTTIQYKTGKNRELGEQLAKYLYDTIDSDEFISVNLTLKGIASNDINPIIEELSQNRDDAGNKEFDLTIEQEDTIKKLIRIRSITHNDSLVITHFKTTNKLTLQGRPLFCYRRITYLISELLDLGGLQYVLSRTDENTVAIVREEVAKDYLKIQLVDSFDKLPALIQKLLISGCCVKLATPKLPEYSMLLFPDLRALEGVLRTVLGLYSMYPENEEYGFGAFFNINQGMATLKENFTDNITSGMGMIAALEKAYTFFRKHRHSLFHMSDFAEASRKIDTLDKALALSKDTYSIINELYKSNLK